MCRKLKGRNINTAIISKTKKKLRETKDLNRFTMIDVGVDQQKQISSRVEILIDQNWKLRVESDTYVSEKILTVRFKTGRNYLALVGLYAPEKGRKN